MFCFKMIFNNFCLKKRQNKVKPQGVSMFNYLLQCLRHWQGLLVCSYLVSVKGEYQADMLVHMIRNTAK